MSSWCLTQRSSTLSFSRTTHRLPCRICRDSWPFSDLSVYNYYRVSHIDGGGEGVLLTLAVFAKQLAHERGVATVDWLVHAVTCVNPNPKLKAILERRGYEIRNVEDIGQVYYRRERIDA
jgi:hypothetical protein